MIVHVEAIVAFFLCKSTISGGCSDLFVVESFTPYDGNIEHIRDDTQPIDQAFSSMQTFNNMLPFVCVAFLCDVHF